MDTKSKSFALVIAVLFLTSLATTTFATAEKNDVAWNVQTVDENAVGAGLIAVDSNNQPHIAYNDYYSNNETQALKYASLNNSCWDVQTVTSQYGAWDFALDSHNNPHILCSDRRDLVYASWKGSNWTFQTVESQFPTFYYAALALDSAGNPQIAYSFVPNQPQINTENRVLKYASWTNSGWHYEIVDPDIAYKPISLALDSAGRGHIMYIQSQKLVYAVSSSSGWNKQTVLENDPWVGNMVLDSNGYPNFIYLLKSLDDPDNALMFCRWNGSAWSTQAVTSDGTFNTINFGFLALDLHNYPHIDFCNNHALMYAAWNGTKWNTENVTSTNTTAPGPLVIDSVGTPHISYGGVMKLYALSYSMYATTTENVDTTSSQTAAIITIAATVVIVLAVVIVSLLLFRRHQKTVN